MKRNVPSEDLQLTSCIQSLEGDMFSRKRDSFDSLANVMWNCHFNSWFEFHFKDVLFTEIVIFWFPKNISLLVPFFELYIE